MNFEKLSLNQQSFNAKNQSIQNRSPIEKTSSINRTSIIKTKEEKEIVRTDIFESTTNNGENPLKPAFTVVTECTRRTINNLNDSFGNGISSISLEPQNKKIIINDTINNISSSIFQKNNKSIILNAPEIKKDSNIAVQNKSEDKNLQKGIMQKNEAERKEKKNNVQSQIKPQIQINKPPNNKNINNNNNIKNKKNVNQQNKNQTKPNNTVNKSNINIKNNINYNVHNQHQKSTVTNPRSMQLPKNNIVNNNLNKNKVINNINRKKTPSVDKPTKIISTKTKQNLLNSVLNKTLKNPIHPTKKEKNISQDKNIIKPNPISEFDKIKDEKKIINVNKIDEKTQFNVDVNNDYITSFPVFSLNKINLNIINIKKNESLIEIDEEPTNDNKLKNINNSQIISLKSLVNSNKKIEIKLSKNTKNTKTYYPRGNKKRSQ